MENNNREGSRKSIKLQFNFLRSNQGLGPESSLVGKGRGYNFKN